MQTIGGREPLHGELGRFYDAIENPRKTRGELPILRDAELRAYLADVRERTLEVLDEIEIGEDADDPLLRDGFVYEMLIAHEHQHNETMLQLLQMVDGYGQPPARGISPDKRRANWPDALSIRPFERPPAPGDDPRRRRRARDRRRRQGVCLRQRAAAARGRAGAVRDRSIPGQPTASISRFIEETGAEPPMYWERDGEGWVRAAMGRRDPVDPTAAGHPRLLARGRRLRPLGRQAPADRARVGGRPARSSRRLTRSGSGPPRTSSPTPASRPSPTRSTRRSFFGDTYKVLRGGSWATAPERDPAQLPQLGPARAPPDLRRHPLRQGREMTTTDPQIEIEVHLAADGGATMARDVRLGL